jgi:hypothetical protein
VFSVSIELALLNNALLNCKNEMGGECSSVGGGERRVQGYGGET